MPANWSDSQKRIYQWPNQQSCTKAQQTILSGGVNSPVRAFNGVGGSQSSLNALMAHFIFDADGKAYIDYVGSWGPMILGHNHAVIQDAVIEAAQRGLSFGALTETEIKHWVCVWDGSFQWNSYVWLAQVLKQRWAQFALLVALLAVTKFFKFEGCYHGQCRQPTC